MTSIADSAADRATGLQSLWNEHAAPTPRPPFTGHRDAPVVIVGGGVAGLSTALHLAAAGQPAVLLEAGRIGNGATGASAGVVAPQLVRTTPDAVLRKLGRPHGEALLQLVAHSGRYLFDLVARHNLSCDAANTGFIAAATGRKAPRELADRVAQWSAFRDDLTVSDADETRRLTGCRGYAAAIIDPSGGSIDPLLLARGLAARAETLGSTLHENSPVTGLFRHGSGWTVKTAGGELHAARVVLAANGGNGSLHQALAGTVLPLPVWQVATEPLPDDMRATTLPEGHSLTDLQPDVFSIRHAAGGRLITAFPASGRHTPEQITEAVNARLSQMLVTSRPLRLDHIWHGTAWVNSSLLPRLVDVEDGLLAVQACNGRGLGINVSLGRDIADLLLNPGAHPTLPLERPQRVAGFALMRHLPGLLMSAALMAQKVSQRFAR